MVFATVSIAVSVRNTGRKKHVTFPIVHRHLTALCNVMVMGDALDQFSANATGQDMEISAKQTVNTNQNYKLTCWSYPDARFTVFPYITSTPPEIARIVATKGTLLDIGENASKIAGDNVVLSCYAEGFPSPTISFYHDDVFVRATNNVRHICGSFVSILAQFLYITILYRLDIEFFF